MPKTYRLRSPWNLDTHLRVFYTFSYQRKMQSVYSGGMFWVWQFSGMVILKIKIFTFSREALDVIVLTNRHSLSLIRRCQSGNGVWKERKKACAVICLVTQELDLDHVLTTFPRNPALFACATKAFVPAKPDEVFLTLLLICEQCAPTVWHPVLAVTNCQSIFTAIFFLGFMCSSSVCPRVR